MSTKWVAEISEHCPGVKIVLCALKCDLREELEKDDEDEHPQPPQRMIQYNEGLEVARKIGALRYLGMLINSYPGRAANTIHQNAQPCGIEASMKHLPKPPELPYRSSLRDRRKTANAPLCEDPSPRLPPFPDLEHRVFFLAQSIRPSATFSSCTYDATYFTFLGSGTFWTFHCI